MLQSLFQLQDLPKAKFNQTEDASAEQLLLRLTRSTTSQAAVAAVAALHDARASGALQLLKQDQGLQEQLITPLLLTLRREEQCIQPTAQVTAAAADLLSAICKSAAGKKQLQQHLPALVDTYISKQHELCLDDTQRQGAVRKVMGTICQVLCDAANAQRLQEEHLQPILQALIQPAPAAVPCQAASSSSAACRNVASSSTHSSDWRSYTVHLLLLLAQQHERFLQVIALKLPELLRGAAADAAAALAVFDLVQVLDRSGGSCQKVVLQELELLLAAVQQQLQPCTKSAQLNQQQQGQQQLLQPLSESGQQQGQQQQLNEDEEEEVCRAQAAAGAAAVLLGLLSSARELLLSQQHLAATVDCLLAVAARYQHSFSDTQHLEASGEHSIKQCGTLPGSLRYPEQQRCYQTRSACSWR